MRSWVRGVVVLSASVAFVSGAGERTREQPLDAALVSSRGDVVRLKDQLGLPTVLFYEDRDSTALNQQLKDELFARGKRDGLLHAAKVLAVANLKGYDWFPARDFALAGVRDAEVKAGIVVLVDWHGTLSAPPWALPARTSSVLLLDSRGFAVFERSGRLTDADREALFETLRGLINAASR